MRSRLLAARGAALVLALAWAANGLALFLLALLSFTPGE